MKLKLVSLCTALAFLVTGVSFAADSTNSKNITLATSVQIGSTVLQPGDYKVSWQGNGPTTNVSFQQGKTTVATAPAKVESVSKSQQTSVEMNNASGSATLQKINFSRVSLNFSQGGSGAATESSK